MQENKKNGWPWYVLGVIVLAIMVWLLYSANRMSSQIDQINETVNGTSTGTSAPSQPKAPAGKTNTSTVTTSKPAPKPVVSTNTKTYRDPIYGFQVQYSTNTFALKTLDVKPPANFNASENGVKLISADRVSLMNTGNCVYDNSGMSVVCSLAKEAGISMVPANTGYKMLTQNYESLTEVSLAGRTAFVYSTGSETDGSTLYFLPLNLNHTLVITWLHRDGFPSKVQLDDILKTIAI